MWDLIIWNVCQKQPRVGWLLVESTAASLLRAWAHFLYCGKLFQFHWSFLGAKTGPCRLLAFDCQNLPPEYHQLEFWHPDPLKHCRNFQFIRVQSNFLPEILDIYCRLLPVLSHGLLPSHRGIRRLEILSILRWWLIKNALLESLINITFLLSLPGFVSLRNGSRTGLSSHLSSIHCRHWEDSRTTSWKHHCQWDSNILHYIALSEQFCARQSVISKLGIAWSTTSMSTSFV